MKKCLYFLLAITLCAITAQNTLARTDCSVSCGDVFVESPEYTLDTQFRALIVKPSSSNLHYAAQATPLPVISPNWNIFDIRTKYHFGFDIGARAHFHNRCTNLAFNYERFNSNTTNIHTVPIVTDMVGPFFEIGPDDTPYKIATGRVKFNINTAHITYGQCINFGGYLETNFFAGIHVGSIKQTLSLLYSNTTATVTRTIITPTSFVGAGPEVGVDFSYDIIKGLSLAGKSSASVLVGPTKNHTTYSSTSPLLPANSNPNIQSTSVQKRSLVVPALQERLGIAYELPFCNHYMARIEAGYQASIYFNAIESVDMGSEVLNIGTKPAEIGVYARTFKRTISNFSLTGAYVAMNVAF